MATIALAVAGSVSYAAEAVLAPSAADAVAFHWFQYTGHDATFDSPLPAGHYRNPILAGFYPDPAIVRVDDAFYLVNSTFAYFPGIPVFTSHDLVHWRQLGSVIDRPGELSFDGLGTSRGVFAPTIQFHAGTFYVLNTAVDSGGNFLSIAKDPAGPWSDPIWLRQIDGIDPSMFVDTDGRAYVLNNGLPQGQPQYAGHRAIWIQELDLATRKLIGPRRILVDGGVDFARNPAWIEGPHLYRRNNWYYLMCAEGGTSTQHSEVVLRSHSPFGPFQPYPGNPILTQRDLAPNRANPVTNAGHADLVQTRDGSWWAVFLASRPYAQVHYNTGRETFLLPVTWKNDWPVILEHGESIPYEAPAPGSGPLPSADGVVSTGTAGNAAPLPAGHAPLIPAGNGEPGTVTDCTGQPPLSGNFTCRDNFDSPSLGRPWLQLRVPQARWFDLRERPGWLVIHPTPLTLDSLGNPSFLARRQQHMTFDAETELEPPARGDIAAGLAAFQNENAWYFLGVRRSGDGLEVFLEKRSGKHTEIVARTKVTAPAHLKLRIAGDGGRYSFFHDTGETGWAAVKQNDDATFLSTDLAGGFVGAVVGPYARKE